MQRGRSIALDRPSRIKPNTKTFKIHFFKRSFHSIISLNSSLWYRVWCKYSLHYPFQITLCYMCSVTKSLVRLKHASSILEHRIQLPDSEVQKTACNVCDRAQT